jgi:hypothetical protein
MAWTLQERVNVKNGVALNTPVSYVDRVKQAIAKNAQAIFDQTLTLSDAVFTGKPVTQNQINEWGSRAIEGILTVKTLELVMDSARMPADPATVTDAALTLAVKEAIWPVARLIGTVI